MLRPDGSIDIPQHYLNLQVSHSNILFLHKDLHKRLSETYIVEMAVALRRANHNVKFMCFNVERYALREHSISIYCCGGWIPNSICGFFEEIISCLKSLWMSFTVLLLFHYFPPEIIITDLDEIVLPVLSWFTEAKIIYIKHVPDYTCSKLSNILRQASFRYANVILVRNNCVKKIVQDCYSLCKNEITVLYPSYDNKLLTTDYADIKDSLSKIQDIKNSFIFVAFGYFSENDNLQLIFDAVDCLKILNNEVNRRIHVIIAGHCQKYCKREKAYYNLLCKKISQKRYLQQITLLSRLTTARRKSLIGVSTAILVTKNGETDERSVLEAMSMKRPIIGTNSGVCKEILLNNVSGLLTEPDPMEFAKRMIKLSEDKDFRNQLGSMALSQFLGRFSYEMYNKNLENLLWKTRMLT